MYMSVVEQELGGRLIVGLGRTLRLNWDLDLLLEQAVDVIMTQAQVHAAILVKESDSGKAVWRAAYACIGGGDPFHPPLALPDTIAEHIGATIGGVVPVNYGGELIALLLLGARNEQPLRHSDWETWNAVAAQLGMAIANAQLHRMERAALVRASLLLDLAQTLGGMHYLPELLAKSCLAVRDRLGVNATIAMIEEPSGDLVGRASSHLMQEQLRTLRIPPSGQSLSPVFVRDYVYLPRVAAEIALPAFAREGDLGEMGLLAVRLTFGNERLGALILWGQQLTSLAPEFQALACGVGHQVSLAVYNALVHDRLRNQAMTDELTGLFNHRRFQEQLAEILEQGATVALVLADVDHFKQFNDTYGHQMGDKTLREVATVLKQTAGPDAVVCRYGGEEFGVILPGMTQNVARSAAETMRAAVANHRNEWGRPVTISLGVACYTAHSSSKDGLIGMADLALYEAKARGRDCVRVYRSALGVAKGEATQRERHIVPTFSTLSALLKAKDRGLYAHSVRVAHVAGTIARAMRLPDEAVRMVEWGALLHDIGKLEIDRQILQKPGPLTPTEWDLMRKHPQWGADLLRPIPLLHPTIPIVLSHHERWDGGGYPQGLHGSQIPLAARIVTVADSFDVMTHDRVYQVPKSKVAALAELLRCAGSQFDPAVVHIFTSR
jgi:diguanylate cyclase (GGDEF)-like protein/putative nucleotidyltransferase with HDIG domain